MIRPKSYTLAYKNTDRLYDKYNPDVIDWWGDEIQNYILDYYSILNAHSDHWINGMYDYSYMNLPIMKALEGVLIKIGVDLGIGKEGDWSVGYIFDEKKLKKYFEDVFDKMEKLDDDVKEEIQMWINDAKRIIKHNRHNPLHFTGTPIFDVDKAIQSGQHILTIIENLSDVLMDNGLISPTKDRSGRKKGN